MKKIVSTTEAPAAVGPYSQAVRIGNVLFTAGQIPLDPQSAQIVSQDITEQTRRVLDNLTAVLKAEGMTFDNIVKTTVFMTNLGDFAAMNEVYASYFGAQPPARSTVEVSALPKGASVEIECIAVANRGGENGGGGGTVDVWE
jgi:2-iminobutanoate/2-iminopropanoate deaminase